MEISNTDPVIIQFLDTHKIDYQRQGAIMWVDDPVTLFNIIVVSNELKIAELLNQNIIKCIRMPKIISCLETIFSQCTKEMAQLILSKIPNRSHSVIVLETVADRIGNIDIFMVCAERFDFPLIFAKLDTYEQDSYSTVYRILKIAVKNGNYDLYNHISIQNNLSSRHIKTLSKLKKVLWTTKLFNPNILNSLVSNYNLSVDKNDIQILIKQKNMDVIECVIDLIDNRKIILDGKDLSELLNYAKVIFPECMPLLESL
jgi:hypothetical protein